MAPGIGSWRPTTSHGSPSPADADVARDLAAALPGGQLPGTTARHRAALADGRGPAETPAPHDGGAAPHHRASLLQQGADRRAGYVLRDDLCRRQSLVRLAPSPHGRDGVLSLHEAPDLARRARRWLLGRS